MGLGSKLLGTPCTRYRREDTYMKILGSMWIEAFDRFDMIRYPLSWVWLAFRNTLMR